MQYVVCALDVHRSNMLACQMVEWRRSHGVSAEDMKDWASNWNSGSVYKNSNSNSYVIETFLTHHQYHDAVTATGRGVAFEP